MKNTATQKDIKAELLIEALKVSGSALGIHTGRRAIKKTVSKNLSIINSLLTVLFPHDGSSTFDSKKAIELGSLGVIALYKIINGATHKKKTLIVEGVFLSIAFGAVWFALHKRNSLHKPTDLMIRNH